MRIKYIGFGGGYHDYPCYKDEKGKIYFDINKGRNGLDLYTGAYRHPEDGDICGEPESQITESVECDEPFEKHPREFDYRMLSRLQQDCEYFLGNGNGYEVLLYYKEVNKHCDEMEKLLNSFPDEDKPKWLTLKQIKEYRKNMIKIRK